MNDADGAPLALRARTIASTNPPDFDESHAGSSHSSRNERYKSRQQIMWRILPDLFGTDSSQISNTRDSMRENQDNILNDAVVASCKLGQPCPQSNQAQKILATQKSKSLKISFPPLPIYEKRRGK